MTQALILLVEDSATQAKRMAALLASYDLQVVTASDGPEGLRIAVEQCPSLIILDVNLPGMDGYQVCSRLKRDRQTAHIPVIMLTAAASAEATLHGLKVGADDYIPKDVFASDNLLTTLGNYLDMAGVRH